ncbi:hypothetical protein PAV_141p01060 (plasmid) [Paenibacillus alvei DSM 29]|nr:hypothetical protein PAV_141p01060 [Paenibacillus alvei DSM 29]
MMYEIPRVSPVAQDFIWVAEYIDGTYLSEFDFQTKKKITTITFSGNRCFAIV